MNEWMNEWVNEWMNEWMNEWVNEWMNEGFRPPLCTYRLNWARRNSWGWWDETALQRQDSQFEPWLSDAELATSWLRRLSTILNLYEWAEKKHFVSLKLRGHSGARTRDLRLSKQAALTTAPPQNGMETVIAMWCDVYVNINHNIIKRFKWTR